jgi:hypothetical protein
VDRVTPLAVEAAGWLRQLERGPAAGSKSEDVAGELTAFRRELATVNALYESAASFYLGLGARRCASVNGDTGSGEPLDGVPVRSITLIA